MNSPSPLPLHRAWRFRLLLIPLFTLWPPGADAQTQELPEDNLALVERIRAKIIEKRDHDADAAMVDYRATIPKTGVDFEMVNIPGGEFVMGSPAGEAKRRDDEGPQHRLKIAPFWMGKHEVTWEEFEPFMLTRVARNKDGSLRYPKPDEDDVGVVSAPTTPYTEMSFGMGKEEGGFPAICMTQHAASKFCQWLSAQTGDYYRLPTEAEWEYACRAGTTTAYHFGDEPALLKDYAWFYDNADNKYQKIGTLKPNPWGLHDMHGNVMEWCLDQYFADAYHDDAKRQTVPATELYPRAVRGGSWYDYPEDCRTAARYGSEAGWKMQDPQAPKSLWYLSDAAWLGFRLVRPHEIPDAKTMHALWNSGGILEYQPPPKSAR